MCLQKLLGVYEGEGSDGGLRRMKQREPLTLAGFQTVNVQGREVSEVVQIYRYPGVHLNSKLV